MNPEWIGKIRGMLKRGEAEKVDDWLKRNRGEVCHTHEATVYFPLQHPKAKDAIKKLQDAMADAFGGVTVWEGTGYFCDEYQRQTDTESRRCTKMTTEPVAILQAFHHCTDDRQRENFARVLKEVEQETEQFAVGIKGTNTFYAIEVEKLKEG